VDNSTTANTCFGGFARMATAVGAFRNSSSLPVFLLDAGDEFMG
jgi:2',3'-cyclic-nucleotide 2'-phosphodiesterase (5'-nucleotidase family)